LTGESYIIGLVTLISPGNNGFGSVGFRIQLEVTTWVTDVCSICSKARLEGQDKDPNRMSNRSLHAALQSEYVAGYSGRDIIEISRLAQGFFIFKTIVVCSGRYCHEGSFSYRNQPR